MRNEELYGGPKGLDWSVWTVTIYPVSRAWRGVVIVDRLGDWRVVERRGVGRGAEGVRVERVDSCNLPCVESRGRGVSCTRRSRKKPKVDFSPQESPDFWVFWSNAFRPIVVETNLFLVPKNFILCRYGKRFFLLQWRDEFRKPPKLHPLFLLLFA